MKLPTLAYAFPILLLQIPGLPGGCEPAPPQQPYDCDNPAQSGLVKVKDAVKGQYIVVLDNVTDETFRAVAEVASAFGVKELQAFDRIGAVTFSVDAHAEELVKLLLAQQHVKFVQEVGVKRIVPLNAPLAGPDAAKPWGIDRVDQRDLPLDGAFKPNGDGAGIHLISIDTGVDCTHPEFAGRTGESHSALGGPGCQDSHGHGTHTAGTFAGTNYGVAKKATVHSCQFLNAQGSGTDADAVECIDWATKLCADNGWMCVVNNSWGGQPAPAIDVAMCRSTQAGVLHVAAAGNEDLNACGSSPAHVKQLLTVGATTIDDHKASFSNDGVCIDVQAPGVDILSAAPGGGSATYSGTSMASPHVAGAAALWAGKHPGSSPAQIAAGIVAEATPGKIAGVPSDTTASLLYAGPIVVSPSPPPPSEPPPSEPPPSTPPTLPTPPPSPPATPSPCLPCPPATPCPSPSAPATPSPPASPPATPGPGPTPATCPCTFKFGLSDDPHWIDKNFKRVPSPVAGGFGVIDATQKWTPNNLACDAGHPNCGGRECNDPRGPLFIVKAPIAALSCDDTKGKPCKRDDPWHVKIGNLGQPKNPMVAGTYTVTAALRSDPKDALGKPVQLCGNSPNPPSTTRSWVAK